MFSDDVSGKSVFGLNFSVIVLSDCRERSEDCWVRERKNGKEKIG